MFVRFVVIGGIAAAINVGSRVLLSFLMPFEVAVVFAYLIGMVAAFLMNRAFVFPGAAGSPAGQAVRFALVNAVSFSQVWIVSAALVDWLFPAIQFVWHAELVGHVIGVLSPVLTSYIGHKHFSFRAA